MLAIFLVLMLTFGSTFGVFADSTETNGDYGSLEELFEFIEEELEILVEEIDDADEVMHDLKALKEETADDLYQIDEVYVKMDELILNYMSTIRLCNEIRYNEQIVLFREAYIVFTEARSLSTTDQLKLSFEKYLESLRAFVNLKATIKSYEFIFNEVMNDPNGDYDGDGLFNYFELELTGGLADPTMIDTDENSINDANEDFDEDGLTNLEEQSAGTCPLFEDSDFDGLNDYIELYETYTDPINEDPDEDKLSDKNEIKYGLDPFDYDSDDNGIKDGDEVFSINIEVSEIEHDDNVKPSIKLDIEGKYIDKVKISNIGESNPYLTSNIPGYIGAPFDFYAPVGFEKAEIKFEFDKALIDDDFYPAIYYFNPETYLLEMLPDQTVDFDEGFVIAEVTHFSTYITLNKKSVDAFWDVEILEPLFDGDEPIENIANIIGFTIDSSGSMKWNDPNGLRKTTAKNFVNNFDDNDMAAVIDFDDYATTYCQLTNDKAVIKAAIDRINSSGGTNLSAGMERAIVEIKEHPSKAKYIIMLTDGVGDYDDNLTQQAKDYGITVFTIGLGSAVDVDLMKRIAESTGGKFYYAENSDKLIDIFNETSEDLIDLTKDTDEDGLSDYHEKRLIRTDAGWVKTDVNNPDTDDDGIPDGEELTYVPREVVGPGTPASEHDADLFHMNSNPTEKDSDFDGLDDAVDSEPLVYNIIDRTLALVAALSYTNLEDEIGMSIKKIDEEGKHFKSLDADQVKCLYNWKVVYANDSGAMNETIDLLNPFAKFDHGLGSCAIKISRSGNSDAVIFGIRGTEIKLDSEFDLGNDLLTTDLLASFADSTIQSRKASREYLNLTNDYPSSEFYLSGHSLGGRIVQDVLYSVYDANDGIFGLFKQDFQVPYHSATFNSLGYNQLAYINKENDVLNEIEKKLINYYYEKDLVGEGLGASLLFKRIGSDIGPWTAYDEYGNLIEVEILSVETPYTINKIHGINVMLNDGINEFE